jgi:hypothetical protein
MAMKRRRKPKVNAEEASRQAAVSDALTAAETAEKLCRESVYYAGLAGAGQDDAAEVQAAAHRARTAANEAEAATTLDGAWQAARLAWAAVTSAHEADARVTAAIAEKLLAA